MSFRSLTQHLQDMLDAIRSIESFVQGMTLHDYLGNEMTRAAAERKLQIISEAAYRLGAEDERVAAGYRWRTARHGKHSPARVSRHQ